MAIPGIVGTATGGVTGSGSFTVTPPGGAVGYLSASAWFGADADLVIPANWTQIVRGVGGDTSWSRYGVWYSNSSPGSSWNHTNASENAAVVVVGYDGAITVEQEAGTTSTATTGAPDPCPTITTTNSALIVRTFSSDVFDGGAGGNSITYPAGHPDGQVQKLQPATATDIFCVAFCHVSQSTPGATGTASYAISAPLNQYYGHTHTLAITKAAGAAPSLAWPQPLMVPPSRR